MRLRNKKRNLERTRGFPIWIDIYGEEICVRN